MFITGVVDTGDKLFSGGRGGGVNDTGEIFFASFFDTPVNRLYFSVSLIPIRK
jgi:hypothetical protein